MKFPARLLSSCMVSAMVAAGAHALSATDAAPTGTPFSGGRAPGAVESQKIVINPPGIGGISVGCLGVTDSGSSFTLDRDNTGTG